MPKPVAEWNAAQSPPLMEMESLVTRSFKTSSRDMLVASLPLMVCSVSPTSTTPSASEPAFTAVTRGGFSQVNVAPASSSAAAWRS